ncbi:hypothetical protein EVA_02205 [gut metagenome]|uniref:Uncharacterized protein n=1 Tax=gut metagenome TaxID=749906 RepID=J9GNK3_9ZZZZ
MSNNGLYWLTSSPSFAPLGLLSISFISTSCSWRYASRTLPCSATIA